MADGMLTSTGATANAPDPDRVFDPIDDAEDSDDSGDGLGGWLLEQVAKFYGVEFDVGDREYSPEEIEEIQELFRKLREGEPVDLAEIQEFYPDLYEYLSQQPEFETYFGDDGGLQQGESTWGDIEDALLEAGYDQEFINELLYDPETGVLFDRTNQNAVTLENILGNLTGDNWDVLQLPTEADYGTFRADMDGDGVYDTVVRCTSGAGSACAIEDYQVVYGAEVDITDPEVQDQIRNAAIYEESQGTEGWEDLEDWEKNQILKDEGYTGPFVFGDGSTMPPDEPEAEQDLSVIEQIKEEFPTWEDIWNEIKDSVPSNPQEVGDLIRGVLEAAGIQLPTDTAIPDILNGGYGVIWDPATGVWTDPGSGNVFVPGIPVGLPPSSTIIGTIDDLVSDPIGTITDKIESVLGDIVADPGGFIEQILTGALEVPADIWDMILGGVAVGQELYDWLIESGIDHTQPPDVPPLGGAADGDEEEKESFDRVEQTESLLGDMTAAFGDTTAEPDPLAGVEDPDKYGFPGSEIVEDDIVGDDQETESPISGEEQTENTLTDLISGFEESDDSDLTFGHEQQGEIGSDPTVSQEPEDTLSGSSGGGGGGGGGGASKPYEFMARLNYLRPEMVPIISQGQVDFNSSMFNKPQQKRKGLQLGSITESLFERFI